VSGGPWDRGAQPCPRAAQPSGKGQRARGFQPCPQACTHTPLQVQRGKEERLSLFLQDKGKRNPKALQHFLCAKNHWMQRTDRRPQQDCQLSSSFSILITSLTQEGNGVDLPSIYGKAPTTLNKHFINAKLCKVAFVLPSESALRSLCECC